MATYKFVLFAGSQRVDGSFPVSIRITKDRKCMLIKTGLSATKNQWNESVGRYWPKKGITPEYKAWNARLAELEVQVNETFRNFEIEHIDWTLNQFREAYLNRASKYHVKDYIEALITTLRETGHIGNSYCYSRTLHVLELYDKSFENRLFAEIDLKYVNAFDVFLQKRNCKGNTRKYYIKTLRAILNKAIQDKEASVNTYPFGKGGFNVSVLEEETSKRYLPTDSMGKLKSSPLKEHSLEVARRLFLFSYYCYGISFIDAALLTQKNIIRYNSGKYIVYKRSKTKGAKRVKPIQIKITEEIREYLDWFAKHTHLVGNYLLPIVSLEGYEGEKLYKHIRYRFNSNNRNLALLAQTLDINDIKLTSYVSRHTMAMTLQDNKVPREVISQILGHSDLATTNVYLDSFSNSVIDEVAKLL